MCHQTQNYCLVITSHKEWWLWQLTKACVCYFLFFSQYGSPFENYGKCLHLKKNFHSQDIQIFVFPSSHPFLPVGHWIRGWSKINRKVYDIINCVNKNLITHFVWHLIIVLIIFLISIKFAKKWMVTQPYFRKLLTQQILDIMAAKKQPCPKKGE